MDTKVWLTVCSLLLSVGIGLTLAQRGAHKAERKADRKLVIGLSLDTLKEARWQRDRADFVARVNALGGQVIDLAANGDDAVQIGDVEKLITRGVDALVIVPHDGAAMEKAVRLAHAANIPVLAYDRLVRSKELDLYVSFDNVKVGALQASFVVEQLKRAGKRRIVRVFGARSDNNAAQFKAGQDQVLAPYLARGELEIIHEDWADEWKPENAKRIVNAALSAHPDGFDAVLASNDGTAGGAIQALSEEGLAGEMLVVGQDAELVACQRIARGTQAMTVYKPVSKLAARAAELALKLAGRKVIVARQSVELGGVELPAVLEDVIVVTKENMRETVVRDGFHSAQAIYAESAGTTP